MRILIISAALAIGLAAPALAQQRETPASTAETAPVAVGTQIYASDGEKIGTVARAEGNAVLLDVDSRAIPIPAAAIAAHGTQPTINITKAELVTQYDRQVAKFEAEMKAALTKGAAVQTADGQALGAVRETSNEAVVVESADGALVLPRQPITLDNQGMLIVRATLDQIKQAMRAQPSQG